MSRRLCDSLWSQWEHTFNLVENSLREFTSEQWIKEMSGFETPAKVTYHNTDVLDYFFRKDREAEFIEGRRFGKPWWELRDQEQPSPESQLAYLADLKVRAKEHFANLLDSQLFKPFEDRPIRIE